ncbi:hypothetical protein MasN3_22760 [Massilia varians]|uniref:Response regulatory domain-containing protein n=1 Tax=Massilia varians TaxID=457921 RepID=A0ABM8C6E0_9BURK|nr:GGDEF domain-containing protein [Massilia varians]BDT58782.1 hypothetical protein MasN3_22760 [Massilia varians]
MSQQEGAQQGCSALFVNPAAPRRAAFQLACAGLFSALRMADGAEQARAMLAAQPADVLVLDLECCEIGIDLPALGRLVAQRAGGPVLVLCPFADARWLPALMAHGPLAYVIKPLAPADLRREVAAGLRAALSPPAAAGPVEAELAALLALRSRAQQALAEAEDSIRFGERLCLALLDWPGVVHAALFVRHANGDVRLEAQHGRCGLDLAAVLGRTERLLESPLRHAFPGLLAASGATVLLDALDKAGEPVLAQALRAGGVEMVLGAPVPASGPGAPRGALCLLFGKARPLSGAQMAALDDLAQLAAFGLRMAELMRESEELLGRVTQLATLDALTGVANRRHGE